MAVQSVYAPRGRRVMTTVPVVVYGTRWCGITQLVRRYLDRAGVPYEFVDLDLHPHVEQRLRWAAGGAVRNPVVYLGGEWLVQPSIGELRWALARNGIR